MPSGYEWLIVLAVIALLFGGAKLPKLARSLGSAKGEFEKGLKDGHQASTEAKAADAEAAADPKVAEAEARAVAAEADAARLKAEADAAKARAEAEAAKRAAES
ncbi:MAG TPA: twin-arginine translocase TatA/TatE family subunit [Acidimicrobiales bacterium]